MGPASFVSTPTEIGKLLGKWQKTGKGRSSSLVSRLQFATRRIVDEPRMLRNKVTDSPAAIASWSLPFAGLDALKWSPNASS
jgi:hypothetical protein